MLSFWQSVQPFLFIPIFSCVGSGAVCIRNTDPDLYRRYSEYGSGSTQLLNTGPICIRIYNIGWSRKGIDQLSTLTGLSSVSLTPLPQPASSLGKSLWIRRQQIDVTNTVEFSVNLILKWRNLSPRYVRIRLRYVHFYCSTVVSVALWIKLGNFFACKSLNIKKIDTCY